MLNKFLGMRPTATEHGYQIDQMLEFVHWIMLVLFIGWSIFFVVTLFRFYHKRNPKADYYGVRSRASTHVEIMVVLVESIFLLGFGIPLWNKRVTGPEPEDGAAMRIRVVAEQYKWNFHYAGQDGMFGRQRVDLITAANPLGIDYTDPAALDDVVAVNEMHIPIRKTVITDISSKDVIHSFSIPNFRVGQDSIPGMVIPAWFKAVKNGEFDIVCGQLCGTMHYAMRGIVVVDSEEDYATWFKEQQELAASSRGTAPAPAQ